MSDAYAEYYEDQRTAERMKKAIDGAIKWKSLADKDKVETLCKLRSEFLVYESRLSRDLSQLNIGCAKENLVNLRCLVLNKLEELGIV